jgi:integrase/recombinase XerD
VHAREKALWRMLYETAARASEVLSLNIEDLDLANRCAPITGKGGDRDWIYWQTPTARLLPRVIDGRPTGPLFVTDRAARLELASDDICPHTGRARLSYRRAAELFQQLTGHTLHQLRHSALTHLAEENVSLPLLMAVSRHQSLRSLQRYARPGRDAIARLAAERDPARRRPRSTRLPDRGARG